MLTVLFLAILLVSRGAQCFVARLPELKSKHALDFVIVNGENAAGGRVDNGRITIDFARRVSVITGDHVGIRKRFFHSSTPNRVYCAG
jgi:calcineurin-like phosphoesterase